MKRHLLSATVLAVCAPQWALAQTGPVASESDGIDEIIVTAQRQSESLQNVPIAVSAFTAAALEQQQIENAGDLQLSLPNVSFTKTNFTTSSFTIRGIGDLCTGASCDQATATHVNDVPLLNTRLFETEYFDLERLEVLRGPQGTLFGRNATSGVVNLITARPDLNNFKGSAEVEYGNFDALKVKAMFNLPVAETLGVRLAGFYQKRDGYTRNLFDGGKVDGRDVYALRGSIRWEPSPDTVIDFMGYYFKEDDNRSRIQKQLCSRDETGILGCRPDRLGNDTANNNAAIDAIIASRELIGLQSGGMLTNLGLGSLYGPDALAGIVNPSGRRTINVDYVPTYVAREQQYMARLEQNIGRMTLMVQGGYTEQGVDSTTDYNLTVANRLTDNPGLTTLAALANSGLPQYALFRPVAAALMPNGPNGQLCISALTASNTGIYGGHTGPCGDAPPNYDRSSTSSHQYSLEAHLDSDFDGPFNFLLGGILFDSKTHDTSFYVSTFGLDYAAGVLGALATLGQQAAGNTAFPPAFLASPFYRNEVDQFRLKSKGLFGEAYYEIDDRLKLTLGARFTHDDKMQRARTTVLSFPVPYGVTDTEDSPLPQLPFITQKVKFNRLTGRAVIDYQLSDDNLLYASYARGYKSGGANPPLLTNSSVPATFAPETVNAFEIGSKNSLADGRVRLNLSAFYYQYKSLQLARVIDKTSVNDNVDGDIYGLEAEAVFKPVHAVLLNLSASWLKSKVSSDKFLVNPRDPSGGRSDVVIIKDIATASNCAIVPLAAGVPRGDALVAITNNLINQSAPGNTATLSLATTPIPGTSTTGAFSNCSTLAQVVAGAGGALPYQVTDGVAVNIKGNTLPQAPRYKLSIGAQYTADLGNGRSVVPRVDLTYTGRQYASIFNDNVDRMKGFTVVNAQMQLNGKDDRWFTRFFVQNLTGSNAITGQFVSDQSSALFTNIFTLEPRRYGIAVGAKF